MSQPTVSYSDKISCSGSISNANLAAASSIDGTLEASLQDRLVLVHNALANLKSPHEQGAGSMPLFDGVQRAGTLVPVTETCLTDRRAIARLARWREGAPEAFPSVTPVTLEVTARWLEKAVLGQPDRMLFWVLDANGTPVGHAGYYRFDAQSNTLEIDNVVRGEKGGARGIMTLAVRALCSWAFDNLAVDAICLRVFDDNPRAMRLYRAVGFQELFRLPLVRQDLPNGHRWVEVDATHRGPVGRHFVTMRLDRPGMRLSDPLRKPMAMQRPVLSIVMPAKNEEGNLQRAYQELGAVLDALGEPYEVLIIDNASTDGTRRIVRELCDRDQRWRYLRFSRDFGVETSMAVGLRSARGDAAMVVFSDLQDPVELIPKFMGHWREGHDVVYGVVRDRAGDPWWKSLGSKVFYKLLERVGDCRLPAKATDFRLLSRRAIDAMGLLNERNRYFRGLSHWIGFPSKAVEYDRHPRRAGRSHAPFLYLVNLAARAVTSFSLWPVEALGGLAIFSMVLTLVLAALAFTGLWGIGLTHTMLGAILSATLGAGWVVGQYAGRTYLEARKRPLYLTEESIRWDEVEKVGGYWIAEAKGGQTTAGQVYPVKQDSRPRPSWSP